MVREGDITQSRAKSLVLRKLQLRQSCRWNVTVFAENVSDSITQVRFKVRLTLGSQEIDPDHVSVMSVKAINLKSYGFLVLCNSFNSNSRSVTSAGVNTLTRFNGTLSSSIKTRDSEVNIVTVSRIPVCRDHPEHDGHVLAQVLSYVELQHTQPVAKTSRTRHDAVILSSWRLPKRSALLDVGRRENSAITLNASRLSTARLPRIRRPRQHLK